MLDEVFENEIDNDWRKTEEIDDTLWGMKDGTLISIFDMTDDHLVNCIRLIQRRCHEDEGDCDYPPIYFNMAEESIKRKLRTEQDFVGDLKFMMDAEEVGELFKRAIAERIKKTTWRES